MNLPDPRLLEDAEWQVAHSVEKLAPYLAQLKEAVSITASTPQAQERIDKTNAMLRALENFFEKNAQLLNLLKEREDAMHEEMSAANFRYRQMRLDRDFYKREAEVYATRYHTEFALYTTILQRFPVRE